MRSRFEIFNIAAEEEVRVQDVLNTLLEVAQQSPPIEQIGSMDSNRFMGLRVNTEKLRRAIPDSCPRPLRQTLKDTYDWTMKELYS